MGRWVEIGKVAKVEVHFRDPPQHSSELGQTDPAPIPRFFAQHFVQLSRLLTRTTSG